MMEIDTQSGNSALHVATKTDNVISSKKFRKTDPSERPNKYIRHCEGIKQKWSKKSPCASAVHVTSALGYTSQDPSTCSDTWSYRWMTAEMTGIPEIQRELRLSSLSYLYNRSEYASGVVSLCLQMLENKAKLKTMIQTSEWNRLAETILDLQRSKRNALNNFIEEEFAKFQKSYKPDDTAAKMVNDATVVVAVDYEKLLKQTKRGKLSLTRNNLSRIEDKVKNSSDCRLPTWLSSHKWPTFKAACRQEGKFQSKASRAQINLCNDLGNHFNDEIHSRWCDVLTETQQKMNKVFDSFLCESLELLSKYSGVKHNGTLKSNLVTVFRAKKEKSIDMVESMFTDTFEAFLGKYEASFRETFQTIGRDGGRGVYLRSRARFLLKIDNATFSEPLKDFFNRMMPDLCGRIVKNFEENMLGVLWSYLQNYIGHGAKVTFDGTDGETKLNKYQNQQAELKERLSLLKGELFHEEQKPRWIKIEEST